MEKDPQVTKETLNDETKRPKRYNLYDLIDIKEENLDRFIIGTIALLILVVIIGVIL